MFPDPQYPLFNRTMTVWPWLAIHRKSSPPVLDGSLPIAMVAVTHPLTTGFRKMVEVLLNIRVVVVDAVN